MKHVFVSYVRDDSEVVDRLCRELRDNGINVWIDRTSIEPGVRWQDAITNAIGDGAFFLACFSENYAKREKSYMNAELQLAIEQIRLRGRDQKWFIPVRLGKCNLPRIPINSWEFLDSIQWADLTDSWDEGVTQLLKAMDINRGEIPFIFLSGSKVIGSASGAEIDRFRKICRAIGRMIGKMRFGIVGCPSHYSRVLAAVEAVQGALETTKGLRQSDASIQFPLDDEERRRFAQLASGAVFVGGGSGTLEEYDICMQEGVAPLIPVAGSGGAGQKLAGEKLPAVAAFGNSNDSLQVLRQPGATPEEYAEAVGAVLSAAKLSTKPRALFDRILSRRGSGPVEDWLPKEFRKRLGVRIGNEWHGPYGERVWIDENGDLRHDPGESSD